MCCETSNTHPVGCYYRSANHVVQINAQSRGDFDSDDPMRRSLCKKHLTTPPTSSTPTKTPSIKPTVLCADVSGEYFGEYGDSFIFEQTDCAGTISKDGTQLFEFTVQFSDIIIGGSSGIIGAWTSDGVTWTDELSNHLETGESFLYTFAV